MENRTPDMNLFIKHNLPDGRFRSVLCKISILGIDRGKDLCRLHSEVGIGVSQDIFLVSPDEEVLRFLGSEGFTVGVSFKDRLICARTIRTGKEWIKEYLAESGTTPELYGNPAITGFCVVDKEFRGNEIQFLTQYYAENLLVGSFDSILTTVSPNNVFSLQNLLVCGYNIIDIKDNRNSHKRYLLKKNLMENRLASMPGNIQISLRHLDSQLRAIRKGYVGYKLIKRPHGMDLLFSKLSQDQE